MIDSIANEIDKLVNQECKERIQEKGCFVDAHQGHSVIREEIEECMEELLKAEDKLNWLWKYIRGNEATIEVAKVIRLRMILTAAEAVQAAAMAQKYVESLDKSI